MPQVKRIAADFSSRRIIGFAANQAFVYFLFYMGVNQAYSFGGFSFERAELCGMLVFMVGGFVVLNLLSRAQRSRVLARPLLFVYAVVMAAASLLGTFDPGASSTWLPLECMLMGATSAFLLTAWGRSFGHVATSISVPEVFIGALVAALVCLVFSLVDVPAAMLVLRLLPVVSVALIDVPRDGESTYPTVVYTGEDDTTMLSFKIVAGTLLFGMAAGFLETFETAPGTLAAQYFPTTLLLLGAFLIGSLSLLLSDGFGKGAALNKSYRLSIAVMLLGVLLIPLPQVASSSLQGEAIALVGYLGLQVVLISLFLVLAQITATDAAASFSRGFAALFAGELAGVLLANACDATQPDGITPYAVVVFAGVLVLFSYIFLFTERDFDDLSKIVTVSDSFEDTCAAIVARYTLSPREAEILPYALRGRTGERIAHELTISKSTVDTHLRRIYAKCGVHSRQELIDLGESSEGR